ncbi:unnamed protein product, partial [Didymodactylos carnosus]
VFESHIVTSIGSQCEHLILIGDQNQLRPQNNVYLLAKNYDLDVSLFERLIKNKLPSKQLQVQHRSIPTISILMKHFYNNALINHETVLNRPSINGVTYPLYFIDHNHFEESVADGQSKRNTFEVDYLLSFSQYLINQGYKTNQITILTTYLGQRHLIQKKIVQQHSTLKGISVTTIDNYQGEENCIILLSLVRSNKEKKIGYLAIKNRICVALSRAQNGLYVIGNFTMLAEANNTWKQIIQQIRESNLLGNGVPVYCPNHVNNAAVCIRPGDFSQRKLGGCNLKCETRLQCGHICPYTCHADGIKHDDIICKKLCLKSYDDCQHHCQKTCHYSINNNDESKHLCPPCTEEIPFKMVNCEHTCNLPCFMKKANKIECAIQVQYTCTNGHTVYVRCCDLRLNEHDQLCNHPCDSILACGHKCCGTCSTCLSGRLHQPCNQEQIVVYFCGHSEKTPCGELFGKCMERYFKLCDHTDIPPERTRSLQCDIHECNRYCLSKCKHSRCSRRCYDLCDRDKCDLKCGRKFPCGHYCNGICGEPCLQCLICNRQDLPHSVTKHLAKNNIRTATFVELECHHIILTEEIDQHVETFKQQRKSVEDIRHVFRAHFLPNGFFIIDYPRCPQCSYPIVRVKRYVSLIKRIHLLIRTALPSFESTTITDRLIIRDNIKETECLPTDIRVLLTVNHDNHRRKIYYKQFLHMCTLYNTLPDNVKQEVNKCLKSLFSIIERKKSVWLTKQQWLDLESEYNRLLFLSQLKDIRYLAELEYFKYDNENNNKNDTINVLSTIIETQGIQFNKDNYQICIELLHNNNLMSSTKLEWTSLFIYCKTMNDFEKDRQTCDQKWIICPKGKHLIWTAKSSTEEIDQLTCAECTKKEPEITTTSSFSSSRGRGRNIRTGRGGPPGTGKTFIGVKLTEILYIIVNVLLDVKNQY